MSRQPRDEREMTARETADREAWEALRNQEYHQASDLEYFTPPPRGDEHLGWVARGERNANRERRRAAEGYRPVYYSDYPGFAPFQSLLAAGSAKADEPVTFGDDLALMRIPVDLIERKRRFIERQTREQNQGAHGVQDIAREAGIPLTDRTRSESRLERHGPLREASFGDT